MLHFEDVGHETDEIADMIHILLNDTDTLEHLDTVNGYGIQIYGDDVVDLPFWKIFQIESDFTESNATVTNGVSVIAVVEKVLLHMSKEWFFNHVHPSGTELGLFTGNISECTRGKTSTIRQSIPPTLKKNQKKSHV